MNLLYRLLSVTVLLVFSSYVSAVNIDVPTYPAPSNFTASPNPNYDGNYTLSWGGGNSQRHAVNATSDSSAETFHVSVPPGTSTIDSSQFPSFLKNSGEHSFTVQACDEIYCSLSISSVVVSVVPAPPEPPSIPPTITTPAADSNGAYSISWGASSGGATEYQLQEKREIGGTYTTIYSGGTALSYSVSGKADGVYYYKVRACNASGCSDYKTSSTTIVANKPGLPTNFSGVPATDDDGSFTVTWGNASGNVTHYQLYYRLNGGSLVNVHSGLGNSRSISGLVDGSYVFQLRAANKVSTYKANSGWLYSGTLLVANKPGLPASISANKASATDNDISISWASSSAHADQYRLEQSYNSGTWAEVYRGTNVSFPANDSVNGSYRYRVKACNTQGSYTSCSNYALSNTVSVTLLETPVGISGPNSSSNGSYSISWPASAGAVTHYVLEEKINSGSWSSVQSSLATSYAASGKADGAYRYRIQACSALGCTSFSPVKTINVSAVTAPATISGPGHLEQVDDYSVTWTAASGTVTHYQLEEKPKDGAWSQVYSGGNLQYDFVNHAYGDYRYRVRACSSVTCSAFSNEEQVSLTLTLPPNTAPSPYDAMANLASLVSPSLVNESDAIGSTAGQFRVNESGSATYDIPLSVPAGTAGVTPQLSLSYNSGGGNGLVGLGWSLQGLSGISRCRQTLGQDQNPKAITWTVEDRFCLDGQRLIVQGSAAYGSVGASYKTEIDSFAKVTSHGGALGQPGYFTVERKDGSKTYYGNTLDAQQRTPDAQFIMSWAQKRFEDSVGNAINYVYANDVDGQRISSIQYGGSTENLSEVVFNYIDRPDDISGYVADHFFATRKLLSDIQIKNNQTTIKAYTLNYLDVASSLNKTQRLTSVQECSLGNCLPATQFEWSESQISFSSTGSSVSLGGSHSRDLGAGNFQPADINGDGLMDIVWFYHLQDGANDIDYVLRYALSDGTKLVPAKFSNDQTGIRYSDDGGLKYQIIDYNADGRQDVIVKNGNSGNWKVHLAANSGNGWQLNSGVINTPISDKNATFGDLNSDGLVDSIHQAPLLNGVSQYNLERTNTGAVDVPNYYGFTSMYSPILNDYLGLTMANVVEFQTGMDWNGDGIQDIFYRGGGFGVNADVAAIVSKNGWYRFPMFSELQDFRYDLVAADINADGLSDIYYLDENDTLCFELNKGSGFDRRINENCFQTNADNNLRTLDYNNDGYLDISWHDIAAKAIKLRVWDNAISGFLSPVSIRSTSGSTSAAHMYFDVNGDGITDYVKFKSDKLYTYLGQANGASENKITKITNGLGASTDVTYKPLGISGHYERLTIGTQTTTSEFCFNGTCTPYTFSTADTAGFYSALNSDWTGTDTLGKTGPVLELNGPMAVVTNVSSSAPTATDKNATSSISYHYAEAKIQASGRGFLGFERLKTIDDQTGVQTITTYRQDWPFIGYPQKTEVYSATNKLLSESENTWRLKGFQSSWGDTAKNSGTAALGSLQPYIEQSIEKTYALAENGLSQGGLLQTITTNNTYDDYGNPTQIMVSTQDSNDAVIATKTTDNTYGASVWEQEMGRLSRTDVTTVRNGNAKVRSSAFNYYTTGVLTGLLKEEIIEPDLPEFTLLTSYEYDSVGNKVKATQSASGESNRVTESVFDADGRYLLLARNGMGQVTQQVLSYNDFGQPTSVRDINGVQADMVYSPMGRKYFEANAAGAYSSTLLAACDADCPTNGVYLARAQQAGGGESKTYYDVLGREVRAASRQFDGSWALVDTEYDELGRVSRKSEPHGGTAQYWTSIAYDILGRAVSTSLPGVANDATVTYNGLTTVTTNPLGQTKTEVKNVLGELTNVYDHMGGQISYQYDVDGNLLTVTQHGSLMDPHNLVVAMTYDHLGRKTAMNDPDKGDWTYQYNAFGELVQQTDAKSQVSTLSYDTLGRMVGRIDKRANASIESNTTWTYNNATTGTGLGALLNVEDVTSGYIKVMGYDNLGRLNETVTSLAANDDHYAKVTYDEYGRSFQSFDAAGDGSWQDNVTQSHYNAYGYLEKVSDGIFVNGVPKTTFYTVKAMDRRGNVTEALHGNGATTYKNYEAATGRLINLDTSVLPVLGNIQKHTYNWDELGNLLSRHDGSGSKDITESFVYDELNRLTRSAVTNQTAQTLTYNSLGNITHKSDVGSYTYGHAHINQGAGPHAVTATGDGVTYQYDANGNMTSDSAVGNLGGRTLSYTTFDKPDQITKGSHTTTFKYGPNRSRYLRTDNDGTNTTVTKYIGNVEKLTKANGSQEIKRYIGNVLVTISKGASGSVTGEKAQYLFKDHLGSVDVITDAIGSIEQELSFDAWGQRRSGIDWNTVSVSDLLNFDHSITTRGFTGHEMLDEVGLIHMNGRVYDARLGRFLQADPFIDGFDNTQGFNRYSYVHNNPLNAIDPSGFFFKKLIKIVAVAAVAYFTFGAALGAIGNALAVQTATGVAISQGALVFSHVAAGAIAGFAAGFSAAAFSGASLKDSLKAGAKGAVSGSIMGGVSGLLAATGTATAGTFASDVTRVFAKASGGCVSASAAGGRCSEGARMAALQESMQVLMDRTTGTQASMETASEDAKVKLQGEGIYSKSSANVGKSIEIPSEKPDGMSFSEYRKLRDLVGSDLNDLNIQDRINLSALDINKGKFKLDYTYKWDTEGGRFMSGFAKYVPGMNSMATFHDKWMAVGRVQDSFTLGWTIAPAMYANYQALGYGYYSRVYDYDE